MIRFYLYKCGSFLLDESSLLDQASPYIDEGIWLSVIDAVKVDTVDHSRLMIPIRFTTDKNTGQFLSNFLTDSDKVIVWMWNTTSSLRYKANVKNVILDSNNWFLTASFSIQSIESLIIGD